VLTWGVEFPPRKQVKIPALFELAIANESY
jgi:hypothetical protein